MKKIIKNRVYDTDKATLVGTCEHGYVTDFDWYEESLYRKKNGEYFIHGSGFAASPYRKAAGIGGWMPGEAITPMSYDDARKWAEENLEFDEYEREFGLPAEDDSQAQLTCTISSQSVALIRQTAQREGVTIAETVERLAQTLKQA